MPRLESSREDILSYSERRREQIRNELIARRREAAVRIQRCWRSAAHGGLLSERRARRRAEAAELQLRAELREARREIASQASWWAGRAKRGGRPRRPTGRCTSSRSCWRWPGA